MPDELLMTEETKPAAKPVAPVAKKEETSKPAPVAKPAVEKAPEPVVESVVESSAPTPEELFKNRAKEICNTLLIQTLEGELEEFKSTVSDKIKKLMLEVLENESAQMLGSKKEIKKAA